MSTLKQIDKKYKLIQTQLVDVAGEIHELEERLASVEEAIQCLSEASSTASLVFENPFNVKPNTLYGCNDRRHKDRVFRVIDIVGDYAVVQTVVRGGEEVEDGQLRDIRIDRFDPEDSKGYYPLDDSRV